MDMKALDLASEDLRHHTLEQGFPQCPASPVIPTRSGTLSQPVSPAKVAGETSKDVPTSQEPQNNCDLEKVSTVNIVHHLHKTVFLED